jgi:mono/diheme cytochrome c family protein
MKRAAVILLLLTGCRRDAVEPPGDDAGTLDASPVALGAATASAYGCAQCHQGSDPEAGLLSGQTTPVPGSQAYGSNLTPDPDTGMDAWDADVIARAILQAVDDQGHELCPQMPAYVEAGMSAREADDIALYLKGLPAVWHPVPPSVCPPIKVASDDGGAGR